MLIKNTKERFGLIAIVLHWVMALLVIGMIIVGLYMTSLPIGLEKLKFYGLHKEFGFLVLALVILRLLWRLANIRPKLLLPWWEKTAALCAHWAFYLILFAMPITGWLLSSAAGFSISFFGLFTIPTIIPANEARANLFGDIHQYIAYALITLIVIHILAALKHHFIDKDNILRRMIS